MKLYDQGVFIVDDKTIISEDEAVNYKQPLNKEEARKGTFAYSIIRVVMIRT